MKQAQRHDAAFENEATLARLLKVSALHAQLHAVEESQPAEGGAEGGAEAAADAEFVHAGNFEAYRAIAHLRLGQLAQAEQLPISPHISLHLPTSPHISPHLPTSPYISPYLAQAEEAATRAVALTEGVRVGGVVRPFALCTLGNVRERGGDEAGRDLALYAEAEGLYLAAHLAGSKDAATAECYMRVQAKRSEAVEFTLLPARIGVDVVMSGQARALAKWSPKPLPPRTTP